jgi:hypothetical protein
MAKFAIFSKGCSINNLYRIARNEETKNHYFLDDLYAKILLTDQQYLDLIKRNKKVSFDLSTNQMYFEDINFEQELINSGFEVKYIDALNSDLEKKGIIDRIDLFLNNRKSNEPDYNYWQSAKTNLNNFNVNSVNYSNNYKNFQVVLEASGQDIIDSVLIP